MSSKSTKIVSIILLSVWVLTGCTSSGSETVKSIQPTPPSTASPVTDSAVTTTAVHTAQPLLSESIEIGESNVGFVYEWRNKLYALDSEGVYTELGDIDEAKFSPSISADGSHLLYNHSAKKVPPAQVICDLKLLDVKSGQETKILQNNMVEPCHTFGWLENHIYVQWNEFPSRGLTDFSVFDGKSGTMLEKGRLYQHLNKSETRIVLLLPRKSTSDGQTTGADIRIGALTKDGVFHQLFALNVYEVQFLDIQLSESLGALTIWTHHVPTNSSELWMAPLNVESWSTGEWESRDIKPNPDGGTISYDDGGYVVLSDGRRFKLPWLE